MSLISLIDVLYVVLYTYCLIPGGRRLYVVLHIVLYRVEDVFYVVLYIVLYRVVDVSALDVYRMIHISTFLKLRRPSLFFLDNPLQKWFIRREG
jgi:hypothetical protein